MMDKKLYARSLVGILDADWCAPSAEVGASSQLSPRRFIATSAPSSMQNNRFMLSGPDLP